MASSETSSSAASSASSTAASATASGFDGRLGVAGLLGHDRVVDGFLGDHDGHGLFDLGLLDRLFDHGLGDRLLDGLFHGGLFDGLDHGFLRGGLLDRCGGLGDRRLGVGRAGCVGLGHGGEDVVGDLDRGDHLGLRLTPLLGLGLDLGLARRCVRDLSHRQTHAAARHIDVDHLRLDLVTYREHRLRANRRARG